MIDSEILREHDQQLARQEIILAGIVASLEKMESNIVVFNKIISMIKGVSWFIGIIISFLGLLWTFHEPLTELFYASADAPGAIYATGDYEEEEI